MRNLPYFDSLLVGLIKIVCILIMVAFYTIAERKVMASIQRRLGPNVEGGTFGLFQPIADGLKLGIKELIIPSRASNIIFIGAPCLIFILSTITWSLFPFWVSTSNNFEIIQEFIVFSGFYNGRFVSSTHFSVIFLLALSSLNVYGIILGGWSSNSKYAFLGALRSAAQMISYEVSIGLTILPVVILSSSFNFVEIVHFQTNTIWYCFQLFPCAVIFFISMLAETNRAPFDLPEAEAELVAGYNVEYSSMVFALFFLGEYSSMLIMCCFFSILFLGGWSFPILTDIFSIFGILIFSIKILLISTSFIFVRAALPRYRYDQLMNIGWINFLPFIIGFILFIISIISLFYSSSLLCLFSFFSTRYSHNEMKKTGVYWHIICAIGFFMLWFLNCIYIIITKIIKMIKFINAYKQYNLFFIINLLCIMYILYILLSLISFIIILGFYSFSFLCIFAYFSIFFSLNTFSFLRPVATLLCVLLIFINLCFCFFNTGSELLLFIFLIVYLGALMMLSLFIIMLFDIRQINNPITWNLITLYFFIFIIFSLFKLIKNYLLIIINTGTFPWYGLFINDLSNLIVISSKLTGLLNFILLFLLEDTILVILLTIFLLFALIAAIAIVLQTKAYTIFTLFNTAVRLCFKIPNYIIHGLIYSIIWIIEIISIIFLFLFNIIIKLIILLNYIYGLNIINGFSIVFLIFSLPFIIFYLFLFTMMYVHTGNRKLRRYIQYKVLYKPLDLIIERWFRYCLVQYHKIFIKREPVQFAFIPRLWALIKRLILPLIKVDILIANNKIKEYIWHKYSKYMQPFFSWILKALQDKKPAQRNINIFAPWKRKNLPIVILENITLLETLRVAYFLPMICTSCLGFFILLGSFLILIFNSKVSTILNQRNAAFSSKIFYFHNYPKNVLKKPHLLANVTIYAFINFSFLKLPSKEKLYVILSCVFFIIFIINFYFFFNAILYIFIINAYDFYNNMLINTSPLMHYHLFKSVLFLIVIGCSLISIFSVLLTQWFHKILFCCFYCCIIILSLFIMILPKPLVDHLSAIWKSIYTKVSLGVLSLLILFWVFWYLSLSIDILIWTLISLSIFIFSCIKCINKELNIFKNRFISDLKNSNLDTYIGGFKSKLFDILFVMLTFWVLSLILFLLLIFLI